jgi:hypothetical protein
MNNNAQISRYKSLTFGALANKKVIKSVFKSKGTEKSIKV